MKAEPQHRWGIKVAAALLTGAAVWGVLTLLDSPKPGITAGVVTVVNLVLYQLLPDRKAKAKAIDGKSM